MQPGRVGSTEFGRALRRWRDRVAPEAVGLPVGRRRRATGLRREELAGLAAISADYLTRLEQGRATSPSAQVVESLARALRLGDADRDLLFELAGLVAPGPGLVPTRLTRASSASWTGSPAPPSACTTRAGPSSWPTRRTTP